MEYTANKQLEQFRKLMDQFNEQIKQLVEHITNIANQQNKACNNDIKSKFQGRSITNLHNNNDNHNDLSTKSLRTMLHENVDLEVVRGQRQEEN